MLSAIISVRQKLRTQILVSVRSCPRDHRGPAKVVRPPRTLIPIPDTPRPYVANPSTRSDKCTSGRPDIRRSSPSHRLRSWKNISTHWQLFALLRRHDPEWAAACPSLSAPSAVLSAITLGEISGNTRPKGGGTMARLRTRLQFG